MHIALYRKYRPKVFEDVVAQEHITKTLKNQVKQDKVSHAYIFCGPRGTGKTTTAKIMSRAVNCLNLKDGNPCNECENCLNILNEKTLDVLEIDAASNTSVNDVRQIRDEIRYPPSVCKKRVYIIDEVHMLSTGAFNALLKTLEEPPSHALFILATTDIQKVPATILSRCQRFDFKRISTKDIYDRLRMIVKQERISIDDEALYIISQKAEGALRDALTILERCVNTSDEHISFSFVANLLGVSSFEIVKEYLLAVIDNNSIKALKLINTLWDEGGDVGSFLDECIRLLRSALLVRLGAESFLAEFSDDLRKFITNMANLLDSSRIIQMIRTFVEVSNQIKWTRFVRVVLEINTIKLCDRMLDESIESLFDRLKKLENRVDQIFENPGITSAQNIGSIKKKKDTDKRVNTASDTNLEKEDLKDANLNDVIDRFQEIKEAIKDEKPGLAEVLQSAKILVDDSIKICFEPEDELFAEILKQNIDYFLSTVKKIVGFDCKIDIIVDKNSKDLEPEVESDDQILERLKGLFPDSEIKISD